MLLLLGHQRIAAFEVLPDDGVGMLRELVGDEVVPFLVADRGHCFVETAVAEVVFWVVALDVVCRYGGVGGIPVCATRGMPLPEAAVAASPPRNPL